MRRDLKEGGGKRQGSQKNDTKLCRDCLLVTRGIQVEKSKLRKLNDRLSAKMQMLKQGDSCRIKTVIRQESCNMLKMCAWSRWA